MRVELEKVVLSCSPLTDEIFIGTLNPSKTTFRNKVNVTNMFLDAVIKRWENKSQNIRCGSHEWEITVKKIKCQKKK